MRATHGHERHARELGDGHARPDTSEASRENSWDRGALVRDRGHADSQLASFKFARQKSKLAGTIRGSYFAFKNEY